MANILEIEGFLEDGAVREPFVAYITAPSCLGKQQEYFCSVDAPALFKKDKRILGINAAQAQELAVQFLESMLEGKRLTDKSGMPVDLAQRAKGKA